MGPYHKPISHGSYFLKGKLFPFTFGTLDFRKWKIFPNSKIKYLYHKAI